MREENSNSLHGATNRDHTYMTSTQGSEGGRVSWKTWQIWTVKFGEKRGLPSFKVNHCSYSIILLRDILHHIMSIDLQKIAFDPVHSDFESLGWKTRRNRISAFFEFKYWAYLHFSFWYLWQENKGQMGWYCWFWDSTLPKVSLCMLLGLIFLDRTILNKMCLIWLCFEYF